MHISAAHTIQLYHLYKEYLTTTSVTSKVEDFMNQKTCIKFIRWSVKPIHRLCRGWDVSDKRKFNPD